MTLRAGSDKGWSKDFPLYIRWELTNYCNYSCSYCCQHALEEYRKCIMPPFDLLKKGVDHLSHYKNPIHIDLFGGEPTLIDGLLDLWVYIAEKMPHANIQATSNGSPPLSYFEEFVQKLSPHKERCAWSLSYHIENSELEGFIEKVNYLSKNGFKVYVTLMCHPQHFIEIKQAYEQFQKSLSLMTHPKKLNDYKENNLYAPEYLNWINENDKKPQKIFIENENEKKYYTMVELVHADLNRFKGMQCEARHCLTIKQTGHVIHSCGAHADQRNTFKNNIFLENNTLKENFFDKINTPIVCPQDTCDCCEQVETKKWHKPSSIKE